MSLDKIHKVGELIAAITVVISLIFVGLQVRDNTIASEAATYQASVGYDIELLSNLATNPDLARAFNAYLLDVPDGLDDVELLQARWQYVAILRHLENLFLQRQVGMLSDESWATREALIRNNIIIPGFEKFLDSTSAAAFSGQFIDYAKRIRADFEDQGGE